MVAVIAQMNIDVIFSGFGDYPRLGEEVIARDFDIQLGGGAQVIPIVLSRLGIRTKLGTFLTDDILSVLANQMLSQIGFQGCHNLYRGSGRPVVITSVFSFPQDRSFLGYNENVTDAHLPDETVYEFLKGSKICFAPQSEAVLRRLKKDGTKIVYDIGWHENLSLEQYKEILRYTDVFMPNDKEAMYITGTDTPEDALRRLADYVACPIVKMGKQGCISLKNGDIVRVGAVEHLIPVDTTGAGDNFMAGFIFGMYHDWDLVKCMQMANVMGGYSTVEMGCFKAGITREKAMELMRYYES